MAEDCNHAKVTNVKSHLEDRANEEEEEDFAQALGSEVELGPLRGSSSP